MEAWESIKKELESKYLAKSLRGRLAYDLLSRRGCHVELVLDGQKIHDGHFYDFYLNSHMVPRDERRFDFVSDLRDDNYLNPGIADYDFFVEAYETYTKQTPEENLADRDILVSLLTILDDRVSNAQLRETGSKIRCWPPILQYVYYLRCRAEGIELPFAIIVTGWKWPEA